jgi:hypothetical protein
MRATSFLGWIVRGIARIVPCDRSLSLKGSVVRSVVATDATQYSTGAQSLVSSPSA